MKIEAIYSAKKTAGHRQFLAELLQDLLPNARVTNFSLLFEPASSRPTSALGIRAEAAELLESLYRQRRLKDASEIIFVGYKFGGVIVKQALVLANKRLKYHTIASSTSRLFFLRAPQRAIDFLGWEALVLDTIPLFWLQDLTSFGKLLQDLAKAFSDLSREFLTIARRYDIVSFYEEKTTLRLALPLSSKDSTTLGSLEEEQISLNFERDQCAEGIGFQLKPLESISRGIGPKLMDALKCNLSY
ncbi:MAG: hypothetical protein MMC33_003813 [Icmadophila ericetorum]|nr:hypothetical protein [Icmadophila ericetorum]